MKNFSAILLLIPFLFSCHFSYHPDEVKPNAQQLNALNIAKINALPSKSTFRFVLAGDMQRFYDETDDFIDNVNSTPDISFVLLNGDLVEFGLDKEYNWMADKFKRLKVPYINTIGNHDMIANGRLIYKEMFGPEDFTFHYSDCNFVCLNTNAREVGYDGTIPDMPWLKDQLIDSSWKNVFILSHVPPFSMDFDRKMEYEFKNVLASNPRVHLSLHGHEHNYLVTRPYREDITFLVAGAGNQRNYALVTVSGTQFTIEQKFY